MPPASSRPSVQSVPCAPIARTAAAAPGSAPFRRALVIANPTAGRGRAPTLAQDVARGLSALGVEAEVHLTRARGDAQARVAAAADDVDLLVSIGGDGTLREVFAGQRDARVPVAVLTMGTANVLGLDLGLPHDVERLLATVRGAKRQAIDVAQANGQLSFLVCGVGFDGRVVAELDRRRRGPITKAAYVPAALRALRDGGKAKLAVELDGRPLPEAWAWVLVSNIVHYGGCVRLGEPRAFDDGLFEVYLFPRADPLALAALFLRGRFGSIRAGRACRVERARRVRVTSAAPVPVQIDGDPAGTTPFTLCVQGEPRTLLVP